METQAIVHATIYPGGTNQPINNGFIRFSDKILEVGEMTAYQAKTDETVSDGNGKIIIPGMIDVHIHGGYGIDIMDADPEKTVAFSKKLLVEGVTSFFATTMTQDHKQILKALEAVKVAKKMGASIEGVHLEGPFISKKRAGAQPLEYICKPELETFLTWHEACGSQIKLVTYAPELEGAREFEQLLLERGIVLSVGHSDAVRDELLSSQATHATHLFNGMRGLHHREPGVAGHALLTDGMQVEIIADGIHVHPDMVNLVFRLKGAKGITLISDAMRAKGLQEGDYELGGQKVIVEQKEARLENGALAGSVLQMDQAFRNIIAFTGCTIAEAVEMSSGNQAREFGLTQKGCLTSGKDADFVIMNKELQVEQTYRLGIANTKGD